MNSKLTPVQMWQTTDGNRHVEEEVARQHQVFLDLAKAVPQIVEKKNGYSTGVRAAVMALAAKYDFVERKV